MGLGGIGKTQIALELAYRVMNMEVEGVTERYSVFLVQAQSMAAFHKTAGEVVQQLGIQCDNDEPKEALRLYLESEAAGRWVLIVDNVDDTAMLDRVPGRSAGLSEFFPRSPKGRLLITTRQSSIAVDATGGDVVKLSSMTFDEASSFMETSLFDKSQVQNTESIKELFEKLTYLPLTLAQAAAYMNKNGTPVVRYLELCRSADQNMVDLLSKRLRDETHHNEAQGAVATTWVVSFKAIRGTDLNAVRLLSFIRWIESKAIPISVLPIAGSQIGFEDSIGLLCGYGFLSWREDVEMLDMHSLVHLALRVWSKRAGDEITTEDSAIQHLVGVFPSSKWENRLVWRQFLPHVLPLVMDGRLRRDERVLLLGHGIGLCLQVDGRSKEAAEILEIVVAIEEETLTEADPSRLSSQHALAGIYQANGQVKESIKVLEYIVAIQKEVLAETHRSRLAG